VEARTVVVVTAWAGIVISVNDVVVTPAATVVVVAPPGVVVVGDPPPGAAVVGDVGVGEVVVGALPPGVVVVTEGAVVVVAGAVVVVVSAGAVVVVSGGVVVVVGAGWVVVVVVTHATWVPLNGWSYSVPAPSTKTSQVWLTLESHGMVHWPSPVRVVVTPSMVIVVVTPSGYSPTSTYSPLHESSATAEWADATPGTNASPAAVSAPAPATSRPIRMNAFPAMPIRARSTNAQGQAARLAPLFADDVPRRRLGGRYPADCGTCNVPRRDPLLGRRVTRARTRTVPRDRPDRDGPGGRFGVGVVVRRRGC
jgi:hypothetical protein